MLTCKFGVLAEDAALRRGTVAETLVDAERETPTFSISKDEFLLRVRSGLKFHYRRGDGVTFEKPDDVSDAEVSLFANGSVFGAIAWLNGFVPLHASAVVHDGRVYAFSGVSGAGKSTLVAALAAKGLKMMADDVLVLDLGEPDQILCLPRQEPMKLWEDALDMTGASSAGRVRPALEKYYANPLAGRAVDPLPLHRLFFLSESESEPSLEAIRGYQKFVRAKTAFYRAGFCEAVSEKRDLFAMAQRISQNVPMTRFLRPKGKKRFGEVTDFIADAIASGAGR